MKFLIIFLLIILNTFLNAQEKSLKKVSLQLHWKHQFEFAGYYIAKEKGLYKQIGLDIQIKEYSNDIDVAKSVSKGEVDFGVGHPSIVLEKSKGEDIVLLSAILQSSPHALLTLKSSQINTLKDFKDKLIMTNKNAYTTAPFISMFQSKNLSFKDSKLVPHTFNLNDLIEKRVDAATIYKSNEPFILDEKKVEYKIWDPKDYGFDFYDDILFTSSKTIESDKSMVLGFNEASKEGWEYAFSNIEETVDLIFHKYNTQNKSKEALLYEANELKKLAYYNVEKIGTIDKNDIQRIYDIYNLMGLTKNKIDINSFIFNEEENILTSKEKKYLLDNNFNVYINEWKPFSFYNQEDSLFQGLAIDFWEKIANTVSINYTKKYSENFFELLKNTKSDSRAIALSLSLTEDRKEFGSFSKPYISYPIAIATNIKEKYILDFAQLENKKVAVGKGFSAHKLLKKYYPNIEFVLVKNTTEALELLVNEKVFAVADILPSLSYYLHEQSFSTLKISGTSHFKFYVRIMVNKENSELIPIINKAIDNIDVDKKKLIHNKWNIYNKSIEKIDYKLLAIILTPIILILVFISILNYNQRRYISILKEKENRIKEQSKKLEERENILSQYVLYSRTDLNGIIIDVSDAFCEVSGYSRNELIGKSHNTIRHPDMPYELYENLWETIKSGKTWKGEIKNKTRDGNYYWIDANISPEYDKNGDIVTYVSIRTDITANKDFEQQHLKLLEQAKMASLGEMLGNIAHQWRQPLNAISTAASGLQIYYEMDNLNKKNLNEFSNLIIKQAQFLSKTIDTFKNFIKNEEAVNKISIHDEIHQAVDITRVTLDHNFITLIDKIDYSNSITITQRSGELVQIIINLLNNSKDVLLERAIENPVIELEMEIKKEYVLIKIEDNAGGIDEEIIDKIFEPYFTTKHKSQGTGLGLYMSYKMVTESLKGELYVKKGTKGAVFNIRIPL